MSFYDKYSKVFRFVLPTPFTIAIILTCITFIIAYFSLDTTLFYSTKIAQLANYWEKGLWDNNLLVFAMQMMLMLVLGHTLALTPAVDKSLNKIIKHCTSTANAAFLVTFLTVIISLFNWGLGLIFGAIFARKVGEYALKNNIKLNYNLIGAAGYSGLMVWHGGLSGSSLAKVAEPGHVKSIMANILPESKIELLPNVVSYDETLGSPLNLTVMILLIIILPLSMYIIGKKIPSTHINLNLINNSRHDKPKTLIGAEKIDYSKFISFIIGLLVFFYIWYKVSNEYNYVILNYFTPNNINLLLFSLALMLHKNFISFLKAIDEAISGSAGILIQFPLYFGIMGIMKNSGLVSSISDYFVSISNDITFPIFTFISAGVVNIFVPSGGGQWAVQGPIIIQAVNQLNIPYYKSIMALAYGDQLTNMLQPFWALPLLGITGLKAKNILPYTLFLMIIGTCIFVSCLLLF